MITYSTSVRQNVHEFCYCVINHTVIQQYTNYLQHNFKSIRQQTVQHTPSRFTQYKNLWQIAASMVEHYVQLGYFGNVSFQAITCAGTGNENSSTHKTSE